MPRKIWATSIALICLAIVVGVLSPKIIISGSAAEVEPVANRPSSDSRISNPLVQAQTEFGLKLFQILRHQSPQKNIFISPTSIATALSMTYNGASGQTQQEMTKALALQGMSIAQVNQLSQQLQTTLQRLDPDVTLTLANSLWVRQGFPLHPNFVGTAEEFYHATVTPLDFSRPNAVNPINQWVSEKTQGRIPTIIDQLKPDDMLLLINAVYFKGKWTTPFKPEQTQNQPFNLENGQVKSHPLMRQNEQYYYLETSEFQAVNIPYGQESSLSFYVFLPAAHSNLETLINQVTPEKWQAWMQEFRRRPGVIEIPRFQLEYEVQLNDALKSLGMNAMFDRNQANFSQLTDEPVAVDAVKHKTFLEVNEAGTEAAGVTSIGIVATSAPPPPFQMKVDRSFLGIIRDNHTGTLLFIGAIYDPQ